MCLLTIHTEPYLSLFFDQANKWLYAEWQEHQNLETVHEGCQLLLQTIQEKKCYKLLNDTTRVVGMWSAATELIKNDFFQQMGALGVSYIAWVHSSNCISRYTTDWLLQQVNSPVTTTFEDLPAAYSWLQHCEAFCFLDKS